MLELIKQGTKIDFMGIKKYCLLISGALILISILSVMVKGPNYGIDFTGGTLIQVKFKNPVGIADLREQVKIPEVATVMIQSYGPVENHEFLLRMAESSPDLQGVSDKIRTAMEEKFGKGNIEMRRVEMVGPKVGKDLQRKGLWAVIIACVGMLIYTGVRFQFQYGVGAVLALIHDSIITVGAISLTNREISLTVVAAVLTIIGYSINDTIVVYDRIRENLRKRRRESFPQVINFAINETLSRTILTSLTVFLVVVALYILGGEIINDFAFAMIIGVVVGTYSSIFIASPIVVYGERFLPTRK